MSSHLIRAISFLSDSLVIEYSTQTDVRSNGLMAQHALSIPATEEYAERLDDIVDAVQALLGGALEDLVKYPPIGDAPDDSEDDDVSPYDNPLERPGVPLPPQE